jgi:hypothetical protein
MTSVKKNGKAVLWVKKGALVIGPKTFECKEILKHWGAVWISSEKAWGFQDDYSRAGNALEECSQKLGGEYVAYQPKESSPRVTYSDNLSTEYDNGEVLHHSGGQTWVEY